MDLKAWWYSPTKRGFSEAYIRFVRVKFLFLAISKKYGMEILSPKFFVSEIEGGRKPDLLSTDGSGWDSFGK